MNTEFSTKVENSVIFFEKPIAIQNVMLYNINVLNYYMEVHIKWKRNYLAVIWIRK